MPRDPPQTPVQHRTVLIIFTLVLSTIALTLSTEGGGGASRGGSRNCWWVLMTWCSYFTYFLFKLSLNSQTTSKQYRAEMSVHNTGQRQLINETILTLVTWMIESKLTLASRSPYFNTVSFCTLWPCDLDVWPFDLILIEYPRWRTMDYPCDKFGDYSFNRFDSIVRINAQTHRQTLMNPLYSRE